MAALWSWLRREAWLLFAVACALGGPALYLLSIRYAVARVAVLCLFAYIVGAYAWAFIERRRARRVP